MFMPKQIFGMLIAAVLAAGLLGCDDKAIHSYHAPPEPPPGRVVASSDGNAGGMPMAGASGPAVKWTVPADWREVEQGGAMRVATFQTGPASQPLEVAVTGGPGRVGGVLANINRWRGQMGLKPVTTVPEPMAEFEAKGLHGQIFEMTGIASSAAGRMMARPAPPQAPSQQQAQEGDAKPKRMLAAMILGPGWTWFVKAVDTPQRIDAHRDAIIDFAKSFHLASPDAALAGATAEASAGSSSMPMPMGQPRAGATRGAMGWTLPEGWQTQQANPPLMAAFQATTSNGPVRVTVARLPAMGGRVLPNINRWRRQVGLEPVPSLDAQPHEHVKVAGNEGCCSI